ncbi:MAG TPA: PilC/PilY family type IV pilus protein, partial [Burkholderiaceae bacterium]|nr:PilC/PilY family type IV pilus protein [Burkholderiaceae bacterium]
TSTAGWSSSKLFSAVNDDGKIQPMVKRPALAQHPSGGYLVTVATGKFIEEGDKANVDVQSIYGIWDKPFAGTVSGRTELVKQSFTAATGGRTLSSNAVDWKTKRGWYIDLSLSAGERVIGDLQIMDNVAMLATTLAPTSDLCEGGGVSQLMAINYLSGGVATNAVFAVNGTTFIGLSSVTIAGTVANPAWVTVKPGQRVGLSNRLDGGGPQEIGFKSGINPFRTWHQLTIKH